MSDDIPGTAPDPESGAEGDGDQLSADDILFDRGDYDPLDEGVSPPERDRANHWGETAWEQARDEPLDSRLAAEEPDWWEEDRRPPADRTRAGRLVADNDADPDEEGSPRSNDVYGDDAGVDGAGASAEEAAVHWVQEP
ncbi:hypothetical protein ET495_15955 [Xylanimonas allomyrinae]|uniref:DUF5709 domain-containing protein n=1 Tax=Xylanimonas allomyrinae TaxID=2509459 RepID=A0A4P6ESF4_9MICO|nr:DUF5709 domain-containing protein [Xylanimonas allomyrinae]QAY64459.1 hypothetical protein ET495_15955 [Xylanimonas allomyrinae]